MNQLCAASGGAGSSAAARGAYGSAPFDPGVASLRSQPPASIPEPLSRLRAVILIGAETAKDLVDDSAASHPRSFAVSAAQDDVSGSGCCTYAAGRAG